MKFAVIERLKFKLFGEAVPIIRAADIDEQGRINTLEFVGLVKRRDNSFVRTWDSRGWEKKPGQMPIRIRNDKGESVLGFVVSEEGCTVELFMESQEDWMKSTVHNPQPKPDQLPEGQTVNLYTKKSPFPNKEGIIGAAATMDDINEAMDLQKSVRNILIGLIVGAPVWWFVFQLLGVMAA